ncbi:MAG: PDZ domain-containing protein [Sandaracinaceae bacterium]|nr:PDZ domain-containing protein [Sandaracinaceae bacterium]
MRPVREVEARAVHARLDERLDHLGRARRGSEGAHDLGASHGLLFYPCARRASSAPEVAGRALRVRLWRHVSLVPAGRGRACRRARPRARERVRLSAPRHLALARQAGGRGDALGAGRHLAAHPRRGAHHAAQARRPPVGRRRRRADAFARVYRGEELLFETPMIEDSREPSWNATLPRNARLPRDTPLRFEVWDRDTVGSDPVGQLRTNGLPVNAVPGADARLLLEGDSYLTIRVTPPRPHRGTGIAEYEVRPDALVVLRVLSYSPAQRAGLQPGDAVVAIGETRVSAMNAAQAASALSMASHRQSQLTVRNAAGRERTVQLDRDFVWLTM